MVDYVVVTQSIVEGKTGTSGRPEDVQDETLEFQEKSLNYVSEHGRLLENITTEGFGTISVYQMK